MRTLKDAIARSDVLADCKILILEGDAQPSTDIEHFLFKNVEHYFLKMAGTFHKTALLNAGMHAATSDFIVPYDIDLVPTGEALERHILLAISTEESSIVTGYRIMSSPDVRLSEFDILSAIDGASIAPEDQPSALKKQLTAGERFGVAPFFRTDIVRDIGGWDEQFIGWGAEDQDILERYTAEGFTFVRSPEIVYLHLHHGMENLWSEEKYRTSNRASYYKKRTEKC